MRRPLLLPLFALLLGSAACSSPSAPADVSIIGDWTSTGIDTVDIQMTLSETARAISGAGSWLTPTQQMAFEVRGAQVAQSISLLFEFKDTPNIHFHGEFLSTASDTLTMVGELIGGSYRGSSIVFVRRIEED
jgi:hypothetical protein